MNSYIKNKTLIYFLIYLTFIISFIFGENSSGGSLKDSLYMNFFQSQITNNIKEGIIFFVESDNGYGTVHTPTFYIIKSIIINSLNKLSSDIIFLSIGFLIPFVFYTILKKQFRGCNKKLLFGISIVLYLSPYLRSSAVWATNDNLAILFFVLSISKFITFTKSQNNNLKDIFLCSLYIIIAIYIRQYYLLIILLYTFLLFRKISIKNFFYLTIVSFILLIPGILYTYNFFIINYDETLSGEGFVYPDILFNLFVFFTMYLFYIFPFFFQIKNYKKIKDLYSNKKFYILIMVVIFSLLFFYYDFSAKDNLGGGAFYKIYQLIDSKLFFVFSAFMGMLLILLTINLNLKNLIILCIFLFMFPFAIVYQKYYDPIMIIIFFSFIESNLIHYNIKFEKINMIFVYIYFLSFLVGSNIYYLNI